jgi:hypothetical protein
MVGEGRPLLEGRRTSREELDELEREVLAGKNGLAEEGSRLGGDGRPKSRPNILPGMAEGVRT